MKKLVFEAIVLFLLFNLLLIFVNETNNGSNITIQTNAQTTSTPDYGLNINVYSNTTTPVWQNPAWIEGLNDSGAKWVRFESRYYNKTLFEQNPEKLNLQPLDMCKLAKQNGLKTLAVLDEKVSVYANGEFSAITDLDQWSEIVKGQLDGYGQYLDAVEMWNEPDLVNSTVALSKGWYMDGSPEHYVDMLRILYQQVQAYNDLNGVDIKVVAGALGTVRTLDASELWDSGGFFLQNISSAPLNAALSCDYFSIHVYDGYLYPYSDTEESEGLFDVRDAYLKAQSIIGDKPIWITEVGANHAFTETDQAYFMNVTAFTPLKQTDCPLVFWYCYYNPKTETEGATDDGFHGLVNQDDQLTRRQTYFTFRAFALYAQPSPTPTETSLTPTTSPTPNYSPTPTPSPTPSPTPTANPTDSPTTNPTTSPTSTPTQKPTSTPTTNPSPTSSPTVPELSWLVIIPLIVSMLSFAVIIRHRKTVMLDK